MHFDVVFHFDQDAAQLEFVLSNITNYTNGLPNEDFTTVLVVNGPGITCMGRDGEHAARITTLAARGLSVRVCRNAMRHFDMPAESLHPACQVVPAGVIELVNLQRAGFAYIKP